MNEEMLDIVIRAAQLTKRLEEEHLSDEEFAALPEKAQRQIRMLQGLIKEQLNISKFLMAEMFGKEFESHKNALSDEQGEFGISKGKYDAPGFSVHFKPLGG